MHLQQGIISANEELETYFYTETIKLCPIDVYICQFQMYERISFKFSHYRLWSFRNVLQLR